MCIYIFCQYKLFASHGHDHRRWRVLVQRNYFIYKKWVVAFIQVQNAICFIEYIQRSKPYVDQISYVFYADISYPVQVKAVYLSGQWSNLLKQWYASIGSVNSIIGTFIA
jgi:hypothetical protein